MDQRAIGILYKNKSAWLMSNRVGSNSAANYCETHDCRNCAAGKTRTYCGMLQMRADILPNNREEVVAKECSIHIPVL